MTWSPSHGATRPTGGALPISRTSRASSAHSRVAGRSSISQQRPKSRRRGRRSCPPTSSERTTCSRPHGSPRVDRVVFASSNHVVGMFEVASGPSLYRLDDPRMIDHRDEIRPDSLYGTSKVFGEALGRYYAERYEMSVVCLRIGSVLPDDDPDGPSVAEGSGWLGLSVADRYRRLRATWLSQRDCGRLRRVCPGCTGRLGGGLRNVRESETDLGPRTCPRGDRLRAAGLHARMARRAAPIGPRGPLALRPGTGASTRFPRPVAADRPGLAPVPMARGCHRERTRHAWSRSTST